MKIYQKWNKKILIICYEDIEEYIFKAKGGSAFLIFLFILF